MSFVKQSDNQEEDISIERLHLALNDSQLREKIFDEYKNSLETAEDDDQELVKPEDERQDRRKEAIFNSW